MTIKTARAALSHSAFTGISRNHLDRLVAELAAAFDAAREGRLYRRRGGRTRRRYRGAGHPETLTLRDRVLITLALWVPKLGQYRDLRSLKVGPDLDPVELSDRLSRLSTCSVRPERSLNCM